jgi:Protein of unknown function (DUF1573)
MRILTISVFILFCATSTGEGQDWAWAMFNEMSYDVGIVARGAKVEHKFVIENIYEEDVHIESVRATCGCTKLKINRPFLKPWEKAEITVAYDTNSSLGQKDATISVVFDYPLNDEVQIQVHAFVRTDVVVKPSAIEFGTVDQGAVKKQQVTVNHAGRDDWKITGVESTNPYLESKVAEVSRKSGQVSYAVFVTLKTDAPTGYLHDQIMLITNDSEPRAMRIPVLVEAVVNPELVVRPSPLFLGVLDTGQTVTKPLIIQGKTPFRITAVSAGDRRFQFKLPVQAKSVHLLPVTFDAKDASGKISDKIRIETDYPNARPLEVDVNAQVIP